jgi:hypothetical protein
MNENGSYYFGTFILCVLSLSMETFFEICFAAGETKIYKQISSGEIALLKNIFT